MKALFLIIAALLAFAFACKKLLELRPQAVTEARGWLPPKALPGVTLHQYAV